MKIIDLTDSNGMKDFSESLRDCGFAVIRLSEHKAFNDEISKVYAEWAKFFASASKTDYLFDPATQDGYFPFKSENSKDNPVKDLKEFYHLFKDSQFPGTISYPTWSMREKLSAIGELLLQNLDFQMPEEISSKLSEPLCSMVKETDKTLFRILHYPPLTGSEEAGAVRAAAHEDINLITLLPAASSTGLELLDKNGNWIPVPSDPGCIIVNAGDMLQEATNGYYKSTTHRVVNPSDDSAKQSRYSMPLFVHPREEVQLSARYTAKEYLHQRLVELGLIK